MDFQVYNKVNKNEDASLVQNNKVAQNINNVEDCSWTVYVANVPCF